MTHELDEVLKHYGVKGMKWKNRKEKDDDETEDDSASGGGEDEEGLEEFVDDVVENLQNKMKDISNDIKKMGRNIQAIFKDIKVKNREPQSVEDINGTIKKRKPKKETPADIRKRIKETWKDVPDVTTKERITWH